PIPRQIIATAPCVVPQAGVNRADPKTSTCTMLRNFLETRRVRRAFERMVSPETVEALLQDREARQPLKAGRIEFILTFAGGANLAEVAERVGKVADLALAHQAVVHDIVG